MATPPPSSDADPKGVERCNMLWIGPALGPVERACIRSVLRQGHEVTFWCYDLPKRVPEGVSIADAEDVVPRTEIVRHSSGSVALFANRFRYELQRLGKGIWLDADVYLLKPIPRSDYLLAREPGVPRGSRRRPLFLQGKPKEDPINNGILRLPPDSPLLAPLLQLFEQKSVPWWLPPRARAAAWWRLTTTGSSGLSRMPWGSAGPKALTALAKRYGLDHLALPPEVFQPFSWAEASWILDPSRRIEERVTERTNGVHLWNECIKSFKDAPAAPGSFLARLHEEGA